jgi:hypothetical protein
MRCRDNLKQLGLACHSYHEANRRLPPASIAASAHAPYERLSLVVELLPYLEQEPFSKRLDRKQPWQALPNREAVATALKDLRCPTDDRNDPGSANHTNYVGVAGAGFDAPSLPLAHARAGFFGHGRTVKFSDVKDGLANTLLFLETRRETGPWAAGGSATGRGVDPEDEPMIGREGAFGYHAGASRWNFGRVPIRGNAVMGDGSVKTVPDTVSPSVLAALATIAGDDPVTIDW